MFVRRMKNDIAVAKEVQQGGSVTCSDRDKLNDYNPSLKKVFVWYLVDILKHKEIEM